MFSFISKNKDTKEPSKQKELDSILQIGRYIIDNARNKNNQSEYNKVPIQVFINSIGMSVLQSEYMNLIKGIAIETTPEDLFEDIGVSLIPALAHNKILSINEDERTLFPISLSKNLVIPLAWNTSRFVNCISSIGNDMNNNFAYDVINHYSLLILPLNITIMYNGNHSILTGILKGEGTIFPTEIVDITYMYENRIKFDGCNFINENGLELHHAKYFELGILYEVGRLLNENNISFLNEKQTSYLKRRY